MNIRTFIIVPVNDFIIVQRVSARFIQRGRSVNPYLTVVCVICDVITTSFDIVYSDRNFQVLFGTCRTQGKNISISVLEPLQYVYAIHKLVFAATISW
jgi:hypothetical protein